MYLIFDTETTGLPKNYNAPVSDVDNWPRMVQLAWQLHDANGSLLHTGNYIVKPEGYSIPYNAEKVHGISTERAQKDGYLLQEVLEIFLKDLEQCTYVVGHNIEFDINIVGAELFRKNLESTIESVDSIDTKNEGTDYCKIPGGRGGRFKWPTLTELHEKLFGVAFGDAHDAAYDVDATARCFFGLIKESVIPTMDGLTLSEVVYEAPELEDANFAKVDKQDSTTQGGATTLSEEDKKLLKEAEFTHLHVHSQFSILQSTTSIPDLVHRAKELNMKAIALTDHGNMMAAFHFVKAAIKEDIKPILGCEFFVCPDRLDKSRQNNGFQTVLIAKNKNGYHNMAKMASMAFVEGFYYVPRIDKTLVTQYKEDVIATTGGLWGEVPFLILNEGVEKAEEAFLWWKNEFGEDFYVELMRHGVEEEDYVNKILLEFAQKHGVKYFASNNSYYTSKSDATAHDVLMCVKDGDPVSKPKRYLGKRGREFRYGFPNDEFFIKSGDEMKSLFEDLPESILTTQEIADKIETFQLARDVLLPKFDIPEEFQDAKDEDDPKLKNGENNFLKHLTYEGAKKKYEEITPDIEERLDFELSVIRKTGYPGYFLIVQDFIAAARDIGVSVGPGRGSAAGSAVAYCLGITNIDPIKYDLLFERFLNPDRVSMPDIDIDFDDEGRQKVIDYVINKYGANQVAQIITYGTMAAKSSIRDTARVLELPLFDADRIAKLVPDIKLGKLFKLDDKGLKEKLNSDQIGMANELFEISKGHDLAAKTLNQARMLEGSVRNTGIHACGVIITPDDITNFVPVAVAKDSDMWCTQFDNSVVESAGLLKMDFLGLKTLTLIKDTVKNVKEKHNITLDPETFSLEDEATYALFQRGETVGIFQYESPGMQKHLRDLKPTVFADLIAMNALYRPGPLEYIPSFIKRKHGDEPITYDLEDMKEYLEETYGITVYQEQVMLLSQKLAGFTKGEADMLRKAMGKKLLALLEELKPKFINQAVENGYDAEKLEKIWKDWEAFASYAFNKSHSTCYAWVAYQTAYLKAHYPAEYMAAVLSNNMNDLKQVTFFMEECKRMGIEVLGPDVNESKQKFTVNKAGAIRFGLGAIKGAGDAAVASIISEREENGEYDDIFDFGERINPRAVNKKTFEVLAMGGGFDCFEKQHRRQYLESPDGEGTLIEKVIKYANKMLAEKSSAQTSLFGGDSGVSTPLPTVPDMEPFTELEKLNIEKEVVGLYISGHPLDEFKLEIDNFCNTPVSSLENLESLQNLPLVKIAGIVSAFNHRTTKNGKPFGTLMLEDYNGSFTFFLFGDDYIKFKEFMMQGWFLYVEGKVSQSKWGEKRLEFKISRIDLLSELRQKQTSELVLKLHTAQITNTLINQIEKLGTEHPGDCKVKIALYFNEPDINGSFLDLPSKKLQITPNNEFLQELEQNEIQFELR